MLARRLADLATRHAGWMLLAALVLTAGLGMLARQLVVQTSFDALLPEHTDEVEDLERVKEAVGGIGTLVAVVDGDDPVQVDAFAAKLARSLEGREGVDYVEYAFDPTFFEDRALLLLDVEEIEELTDAVERRLNREKARANPFFVELEPAEDEGATLEELEQRYRKELPASDRYRSEDGRQAFVLVKPTGLSGDVAFGEALIARLSEVAAGLGAAVGYEASPREGEAGVRVRFTGTHAVRVAENRIMLQDLRNASILALLLSVGLVAAWTRRVRAALLVGLPLVVGIVWTAGLAQAVFGEVNIITGFLAAVLIGLGIDFGVHLFMRFMEERRRGATVPDAMAQAITITGRAAVTGAATTAAAFFVLSFAEFEGFRQFGRVAAAGVLLSLLATYLVGPPLYCLTEKVRPMVRSGSRVPRPLSPRRPKRLVMGILAFEAVLLVGSLATMSEVPFVTDLRRLQGELPQVELQDEVVEVLGRATSPAMAMTPDAESAARLAEAARTASEDGHDIIGRVVSLSDLVPTEAQQEARRAALARLATVLDSPAVDALPPEEREQAEEARRLARAEPFDLRDAPDYVRHRFVADGHGVLTMLSAGRPLFDTRNLIEWAGALDELRAERREEGDEVWVADENRIAARIFSLVVRDGPVVLLAALGVVLVLLWIDLKGFKPAVLVLAPLVVGLVGIAGLMRITGTELNFLNAVMVPAIVGIGIDNAVHMFHRWRDEGPGKLGWIVRNTGSAAFLASTTTAFGFGSLALAHHDGLQSVGRLALLGMGSTFVATTLFFPAVLWLLERRATRP